MTDAPDDANGHCTPGLDFDADGCAQITWAAVKKVTWGFYSKYYDEAHALISPAWINRVTQLAPPGLRIDNLLSDAQIIQK